MVENKSTLFEKIGSLTKIKELSAEFYDVMDREPFAKELRDIHPDNLTVSKKTLARFISHWLGGPALFSEELINANWLELRHRRFEISQSNAEQWLYCMNLAMINVGIDGEVKKELSLKFERMINVMQIHRDKINDDVGKS